MATSEAQKRAVAKWSKENMKSVSIRITKDLHSQLRRTADANGDTIHGIIKKAIDEYLSKS